MRPVLFVAHSSTWGGAEKCLALLLESLPRERFSPAVAARPQPYCWRRPGKFEQFCRRADIPFHRTDLVWWVRPWHHDAAFANRLAQRVQRLSEIIHRVGPAVVVTNTSAVVEGALAAAQCGVPHVWHVLEMLSQDPGLNPFLPLDQFYGFLAGWSSQVVAVSQAVAEEIRRFAPNASVEVVPTGLPVPQLPEPEAKSIVFPVRDGAPVVLYVGLLSRRKGVLDLIEAARQAVAKRPDVQFFLAGRDGGVRREVRRAIAAAGLTANVHLLGQRDDVPRLLAACDLMVLPSWADPLPVAVLEAISLAVPVVATRSGGCSDMVIDGRTGRLVPPQAPSALAEAILELLADEPRRREMGRQGRRHFETHFTAAAHAARFAQVLDAAIECGAASPLTSGPHAPEMSEAVKNRDENQRASAVAAMIQRLAAAARRRREQARRTAGMGQRFVERGITAAYKLRLIR